MIDFSKSFDLLVQDVLHILEPIVVVIDRDGKSRVVMKEANASMDSILLSQCEDVMS